MPEDINEYNLKMNSVCTNCGRTYGYHYSSWLNKKEVITCRPMRSGEPYTDTYFSKELDELQLRYEIEKNLRLIRHTLLSHV
jgi:hypothetical protein